MLLFQNSCCAICNTKLNGRYHTTIDHDHCSGKVRQLLCRKCNRGLGCFGDDPNIIKAASDYLFKWKMPIEKNQLLLNL